MVKNVEITMKHVVENFLLKNARNAVTDSSHFRENLLF